MKLRTITSLIAALLLASPAFAGRPTTDEVALRLGVNGWFQSRQTFAAPGTDLHISVQGSNAVTAFRISSNEGSRVTLTWEKRDGVWQVVREEMATRPAAAQPALATTAQ